ncbi:MAG: zinc-dependent metalloprotease [Bdellovibrio sp.]|nr:zinc-dependent metalloprotease [Bdellovibrio sp.]
MSQKNTPKMLLILSVAIFIGCAKELPIQESDDIKDNVMALTLFNEEVEIETSGNQMMAYNDLDLGQVVAVNEKKLTNVALTKGPKELAPLFKDLRIESESVGTRFKVSFQISKNYLVAAIDTNGETLSGHSAELSNNTKFIPIFQFPIDAFGIKRRVKNSLGEETRTVEFVSTNRDSATHIRVPTLLSSRKLAGLFAKTPEEQSKVFLKTKVENRVWRAFQVRRLVGNASILTASPSGDKAYQDDDVVRLKIFGDIIYIYRPIASKNLTEVEQQAERFGLPIRTLLKCDERVSKAAKIDEAQCFLRAEFKINVSPVILKRDEDDDGSLLATASLSSSVDHNQTRLIRLDNNSFEEAKLEIASVLPFGTELILTKAKDVDLNSEFLYVPSTHGTPREVVAADPFFQGDEKIVKFRWFEDGLRIYEMEKDGRFTENDLNNAPVLTIPGRHVEWQCAKDRQGVCVGGLSENSQIPWQQRQFFIPNLDNIQVQEVNKLNIFQANDSCVRNTASRKTHHEIKSGVFNIELERTFEVSSDFSCIIDLFFSDNLKSASFNVKYFYSIVRLGSLISPDYETVYYPITEHDDFGFFKDEDFRLNDIYDTRRMIQNYYLNRFNPKKGTIKYHLSKSFDRPENLFLKESTYRVVENINKSLAASGTSMQLELVNPSEIFPGDLRANSIVLIDDPLDSGLLGYGPSVSNPRTGEIVQAHVNMYGGVLRTMTRHVYRSMVDLSIKNKGTASIIDIADNAVVDSVTQRDSHPRSRATFEEKMARVNLEELTKRTNLFTSNRITTRVQKLLKDRLLAKVEASTPAVSHGEMMHLYGRSERDLRLPPEHMTEQDLNSLMSKKTPYENMLERYSKHCAYHKDFVNMTMFEKAYIKGIRDIEGILNEDGTLKNWDELSSTQQLKATELIVGHVYRTTLTHELGHNLGLRHNFIGSADQKNFYTEEESKALGLEYVPQYSSIMDYGYSELNELPIFGKYDIAAFRFGYARKVEDAEGNLLEIAPGKTLTDLKKESGVKIRDFEFCTDENAGLSVKCNRFDEGATITDIARHYIDSYKSAYKYSNFRDGRNEFSTYGIANYLMWKAQEFKSMRRVFEESEAFGAIFGHETMSVGCSPDELAKYPICKEINDRRDATKLVGEFFIEVLKTPDLTCALAKAEEPTKIVELRPFLSIYNKMKYNTEKTLITSCFDADIKDSLAKDELIVIAEGGKSVSSFKGTDPQYKYKSDIDVRGVWPDKLLAMRALTTRQSDTGSTEDIQRSYIESSAVAAALQNFFEHILLGNDLKNPIPFHTEDGSLAKLSYQLDADNYTIPEQPHWYPIRYFGLPLNDSTYLNQVMLKVALRENLTSDTEYREDSQNFVNSISVIKRPSSEVLSTQNMVSTSIGNTTYAANEGLSLAYTMVSSIEALPFLNSLAPVVVLKVLQNRMDPPIPDGLSEDEKIVLGMDADLLAQIMQITAKGVVLKEEDMVARFGPELGHKIFLANSLGIEGLQKIITIKNSLGKAPADATPEEKKLYALNLAILEDFVTGSLEAKAELYTKKLPLMPRAYISE